MNCEHIQATLLKRMSRSVSKNQNRKTDSHLKDCPECRAFQQQINRLSEWIPEPHHEPEPIALENVKRFARLEAPKQKLTLKPLLMGVATAAASLVIFLQWFLPVSYEFSMHESLAIDPSEQTNALLSDMLSEDEWVFQYALLAEF